MRVSIFVLLMVTACASWLEGLACELTMGEVQAWPEQNSWVAEVTGFTSANNVLWINEAGETIGEGPVLDYVGPPATVCAVDMGCDAGEAVCTTFAAAGPVCEVALSAELLDCSAYQIYADLNFPPTATVDWTFEGSPAIFTEPAFSLPVADEPVQLCVVIEDAEVCPEGVSQCLTLEHPGCSGCPTSEEATVQAYPASPDDCYQTLSLALDSAWQFDPVFSVQWDFGDGFVESSSTPTQHFFPSPGTYEVCVEASILSCPEGFATCTEIVVPPTCNTDCQVVNVLLSGDGPCDYTLEGFDGDGYFVAGTAENLDDGIAASFCLPEGCYGMSISGTETSPVENISVELTGASNPAIFEGPLTESWGDNTLYFTFSSAPGACDPLPASCAMSLESSFLGGGTWSLTAGGPIDPSTISWSLSNGETLTSEAEEDLSTIAASFGGDPLPFACVTAYSPACDAWLSSCVDLEASAAALDCTPIEVNMSGEAPAGGWSSLQMDYALWRETGGTVSGSMTASSSLNACLTDGCYGLALDFPSDPVGAFIELWADGSLLNSLPAVSGEIAFGLNAECGTASTEELKAVPLAVFPNPAQRGDLIHLSYPALLRSLDGRVLEALPSGRSVVPAHWAAGVYALTTQDGTATLLMIQ